MPIGSGKVMVGGIERYQGRLDDEINIELWGVAMAKKEKRHNRYYLTSIIPALAAWPSLLVPEILSLFILVTGFTLLISYDIAVEKTQAFPAWYIPMPIRLTTIVFLCLVSTLFSLVKPLL